MAGQQLLTLDLSMQDVRQIEKELCLESLARFVNAVDGHSSDQASLNGIKQWLLKDLEAFHLVSGTVLAGMPMRSMNCVSTQCMHVKSLETKLLVIINGFHSGTSRFFC